MPYQVLLAHKAINDIAALPFYTQTTIYNSLQRDLATKPYTVGVHLSGKLYGYYGYRRRLFQIIYQVQGPQVWVLVVRSLA